MEQAAQTRTAAYAASGAAAVLALLVVLREGPATPDFDDPVQYVQDGLFVVYLVLASAALLLAAGRGIVARTAARMVAFGYSLLVVGVLAGMALREDPEWFALLGAPGNLLAGIGFVVLAVAAARRRTLPLPVAVLGGVGGFFAVLFAEFGSGIVVAVFFLLLGRVAARPVPQPDYAPSTVSR